MSENIENSINYIEFPMRDDQDSIIHFYETIFGWTFTRWSADYISFSGAGLEGGFNREQGVMPTVPGALVILYSDDLEKKVEQIKASSGRIVRDIYPFPGGRRFHFLDPVGNELAIWSAK